MADPPQNHQMDKPCEICGDPGYVAVIRVCSKCNLTREHPYCMRILYEGDPEEWVCEECESGGQIHSVKPDKSKPLCRSGTKLGLKQPPRYTKVQFLAPEEAMVLESGSMKKNLPSPNKSNVLWKSTVTGTPPKAKENVVVHKQHGRQDLITKNAQASNAAAQKEKRGRAQQPSWEGTSTKLSPPRRFSKPSAGRDISNLRNDSWQSVQCSSAVSPDKRPSRQLWQDSPTAKPSHPDKNYEVNARNGFFNSVQTSPLQGLPSANSDKRHVQQPHKKSSCGKTLRLENISNSDAEVNIQNSGNVSVQHLPTASSALAVYVNPQPMNVDHNEENPMGDALELDRYLPNHPSMSPTWKGKFEITHDVFQHQSIEGIQAYPPCKVHRKVYDLSLLLPGAIQFELLPRLSLWTKMFQDEIPGGLDIGLYFFCSRRREQSYTSLLEYLDRHDMLLRCIIHGAELVIFSSKHLEEDSRRINQNYFLWGLFASSDDNAVVSEVAFREESCIADDEMEIDMLGGYEIVDMMDNVVSQQKPSTDCKDGDTCSAKNDVSDKTESFFETQLSFERDLQRCFDRFIKLKQPEEPAVFKEVKKEPGSPGNR